MYSVNGFKQSEGELMKYRDYMTEDMIQSPQQISGGGGLARYRSAPSSMFTTLLESGGGFSDFLSGGDGDVSYDMPFPVKEEVAVEQQSSGYSVFAEGENYNNNNNVQGKVGGLARQTSSPAGFFSNLLSVDNGFSVMSDVGSFRAANGINGKSSPVGSFRAANGINGKSSPSRRLNDHISFSSGQPSSTRYMPQIAEPSSSRYMPQIAENGNESTIHENGHLGSGNGSNGFYIPSFQNNSCYESNLSGLKRSRESEDKFSSFNAMDSQHGDDTNYPNRLTHHLSLPKTSGEMAAIEKYLQFQQDVVPCKTRAKRGFATHPRSIAERVRRTRISDRMKKLQDLFPNMDKQTNTAEMLDLAVEYIKDLQTQVQTLTGKKAKCTCSK